MNCGRGTCQESRLRALISVVIGIIFRVSFPTPTKRKWPPHVYPKRPVRIDLDALNPQQREAVLATEGPVLLLAGAGSGKTRVIIHRIAYLVAQGADPASILAVTFTNKASKEMRERIAGILHPDEAALLTVGTFHAFCLRILRTYISRLGYSQQFSIASQGYQQGLVRTVMTERGHTGEGCDPLLWLSLISKAKSALEEPEDVAARTDWPKAAQIADVYAHYQQRLKEMDQVDFDDLLVLVHRLWATHPAVLATHREQFRHLLIDEYQDTNIIQFRLMATLAGDRENICVVGDDDQSIYGWRGANLGNILTFTEHFPTARVIRLEQNYRSTNTILKAANAVIANNRERHEKKLWSQQGEGDQIMAVRTEDEKAEAVFVADFLKDRNLCEHMPYGDCAVLYRSNHQSRLLEQALHKAEIPYTMVGSNSFFERKEILDVISLLQVVNNPHDDLNLLRILNVPPRGVGSRSIEQLKALRQERSMPMQRLLPRSEFLDVLQGGAAQSIRSFHTSILRARSSFGEAGNLQDKTERLLQDMDYFNGLGRMYKPREDALNRRDNVMEFLDAIGEYERKGGRKRLGDFLETFALRDANDRTSGSKPGEQVVTLMTVHASKGLEFPLVFVVGLERGLFPHLRSIEEHNEEEERRLFYVAITRAKRELVLTYANKRRAKGKPVRRRPSPFLDEIPEELVDFTTPDDAISAVSEDVAEEYLARMKEKFAPRIKPDATKRSEP